MCKENKFIAKKKKKIHIVYISALYGKTYWDSHVEICEKYSQSEMSQEQLLEQIGKISNKLPIESKVHLYL